MITNICRTLTVDRLDTDVVKSIKEELSIAYRSHRNIRSLDELRIFELAIALEYSDRLESALAWIYCILEECRETQNNLKNFEHCDDLYEVMLLLGWRYTRCRDDCESPAALKYWNELEKYGCLVTNSDSIFAINHALKSTGDTLYKLSDVNDFDEPAVFWKASINSQHWLFLPIYELTINTKRGSLLGILYRNQIKRLYADLSKALGVIYNSSNYLQEWCEYIENRNPD